MRLPRRQGTRVGCSTARRLAEATKNLERAAEFDPQNPHVLQQITSSYNLLRRYADQERTLDRVTAVTAKEAVLRASRAEIELDWHGDTRPLLSTINAILVEDPREAKNIAGLWLLGSLCNRDFNGALRALGVLPIAGCIKKQFRFRGPGVKA